MLAEIFMLRLETAIRVLEMPRRVENSSSSGDHRFVPFRPDALVPAGNQPPAKSQGSSGSE
jgi:hypothetical protein